MTTGEKQDETDLRHNVVVQLLHGMFGQTGFRLINAPTFMPVYLFTLGGSEVLVGLARSLQAAGMVLTPVMGATLIGHRRRVLGITLISGALMRIQILLIAVAGFLLGNHPSSIYVIIVLLLLMGLFQGLQGVMVNTLRAKVIPVSSRGTVTGWRNFLAGGTTATLSWFAGKYLIEPNVFGNGYASLFLLAFLVTSVGLLALGFSREPASDTVREKRGFLEGFGDAPRLLRDNDEFRRFFIVTTLGAAGRMAMPFYILHASERIEVTGALLGVLTTLWMLTGTATNLVWGSIADRSGYRLVLILTLALWAAAHVQLLLVDDVVSVMLFFVVIGTATGGFNQARQNMVLELGEDPEIPLRVAVGNMSVNAMGMIGPLLGGLISLAFGFSAVFILCLVLQLIALAIGLTLPEPRDAARP